MISCSTIFRITDNTSYKSMMKILSTETERLIKDTAKKIFFEQGRLFATTREIAEAAGVSRTSINYYYRSSRTLLDQVVLEEGIEIRKKLDAVCNGSLSFRKKMEKLIDFFIERSSRYPYLELFIIAEFNTKQKLPFTMPSPISGALKIRSLEKEIGIEVGAGRMKPVTVYNFIINIMSLCAYPFMGKCMIKDAFSIDDLAYNTLMAERKDNIMQLLFPNWTMDV